MFTEAELKRRYKKIVEDNKLNTHNYFGVRILMPSFMLGTILGGYEHKLHNYRRNPHAKADYLTHAVPSKEALLALKSSYHMFGQTALLSMGAEASLHTAEGLRGISKSLAESALTLTCTTEYIFRMKAHQDSEYFLELSDSILGACLDSGSRQQIAEITLDNRFTIIDPAKETI